MADRDNIIADCRHQRGTQLLFAKRYYPVLVSKRSRIRILSIERQWANILFFGHRLTFPFVPKLLYIVESSNIDRAGKNILFNCASTYARLYYSSNEYGNAVCSLSEKIFHWYSDVSQYLQLNASGCVYSYVALG